jgi:signal transduction histidine kinase
MTFRRKLLLVFTLTVVVSVAAVAWLVSATIRHAFEKTESERTAALVAQLQREFNRQGDDVVRRVEAVTASDSVVRMAAALNTAVADSSGYFDLARSAAENYQLDFLEFVDERGVMVSSAEWPAKFGYPETAFDRLSPLAGHAAFLRQEELQDSAALGMFAVRATRLGDHPVYVIGGRRLDKQFLSALELPAEMRVLLYQNRGPHFVADLLVDASGSAGGTGGKRPVEKLAPLIEAATQSNREMSAIVHWTPDQAEDEIFEAIPLRGAGRDQPLLGVLLVGNSRRSYVELKRKIQASALIVGSGGIILAVLLSSWAAARVTRPVEQLAAAAHDVAEGNWNARVEVSGNDELARLAESFNRMTAELLNQKERLIQAERVAAWRELARRLAHELKNPLFPLQLTVENMLRAKESDPTQFEEVFRESSATLLAEIANLKTIISRFSEFSRMPQPQVQAVQVNDVVQRVAQLFEAQLRAPGRPPIQCTVGVDRDLGPVNADPELLHRAISNLVLNAMDAMPEGGTLTLRTKRAEGKAIVEVSDTGVGLTPEECERIFTPYYTSKQHGTGLGLAIVQSVVSDHGGKIVVQSRPGRGTTFVIELPSEASRAMAQAKTSA